MHTMLQWANTKGIEIYRVGREQKEKREQNAQAGAITARVCVLTVSGIGFRESRARNASTLLLIKVLRFVLLTISFWRAHFPHIPLLSCLCSLALAHALFLSHSLAFLSVARSLSPPLSAPLRLFCSRVFRRILIRFVCPIVPLHITRDE